MYDYLSSKLMALSSFSVGTTWVDSNLLYSNNSWILCKEENIGSKQINDSTDFETWCVGISALKCPILDR